MAAPWTQRLEMRWRPALTFYEKRIEILRCLDDRGVLRAFRVGDDSVDTRLMDARHEMTITQEGLSLDLFGQGADPDVVWDSLTEALERIEPTVSLIRIGFQHIVPLAMPFEESVAKGQERFLSLSPTLDLQDWALLINPDPHSAVEFGIIRADEAADRLTRRAGRMRGDKPLAGVGRWVGVTFPDVAIFADSYWGTTQVGGQLVDETRKHWAAANERAGELVDNLYATISAQD